MKKIKVFLLPILALVFLSSCVSVRVVSDYDREANFNEYKSYAFYKTGIDKAQISDLDKKRILKAIDAEWGPNVSTRTEGSLYIDLIDAKNKELVWQGRGEGTLNNVQNIEKKEQRIREFVAEILQAYPPKNEVVAN